MPAYRLRGQRERPVRERKKRQHDQHRNHFEQPRRAVVRARAGEHEQADQHEARDGEDLRASIGGLRKCGHGDVNAILEQVTRIPGRVVSSGGGAQIRRRQRRHGDRRSTLA